MLEDPKYLSIRDNFLTAKECKSSNMQDGALLQDSVKGLMADDSPVKCTTQK